MLVCFCYSFLCLSSTFLLLGSTFFGLAFERNSAIQVAIPRQFQAIPAPFWQFWPLGGLTGAIFLWVFCILLAIRATSRLLLTSEWTQQEGGRSFSRILAAPLRRSLSQPPPPDPHTARQRWSFPHSRKRHSQDNTSPLGASHAWGSGLEIRTCL